jgi:hypothetical protein
MVNYRETSKAKLAEESNAHRGLLLRKEIESKDYQTRIDQLVSNGIME